MSFSLLAKGARQILLSGLVCKGDTPSLFVGESGVADLRSTPLPLTYPLPRCESYFTMLAFEWQDFLSHLNGVIYDDDNFAKGLLINNE